jgi:hypothetical protein
MTFATLLKPRTEVLSEEGIEGIIDLQNLHDPKRKKLEARPDDFLDLTYPTADVRAVIENLNARFTDARRARTAGLYLFEGLKGSGKSHLLVLVYHLFKASGAAKDWLRRHGLACNLPSDVIVIENKFTDFPLFSIWDFIFERVTGSTLGKRVIQPSLQEVREALGDRRVVLIFDELERGIAAIADEAVRQQNLAFLQMLCEWANRENQVTVFASIYGEKDEPSATLKRVQGGYCHIRFGHAPDKARVVLHRIFENFLEFDQQSARPVVDSYVNLWRNHMRFNADDYRGDLLLSYPFLPELLEIMFERIPARGGFQNVRGALGFLANMVRLSYQEADIVTAARAALHDREVVTRLGDLDVGGDLIRNARSDLRDVGDAPLAEDIIATVLLYTLSGAGRSTGVHRDELLRHVLRPGVNINDIEETLLALDKYASYLHFDRHDNRYYFDTREKPQAKVEYRSTLFPAERAREELRRFWKDEVFRDPNCVVFTDVDATKEVLEAQLEKDRLRYVLAPRRVTGQERHDVFYGLTARNQVILLEPREDSFDLVNSPDLLKWAQRVLAAQELAATADDAERRATYESIAREDKANIVQAIRRAGLVFVRWEQYGANASEDRVELEPLGTATSKDEVHTYLNQNLFPPLIFEEHLTSRLNQLKGQTVKDLHGEYRSTLGYPVPTLHTSVSRAIRNLCKSGKLSVRHQRGNFCWEDPPLSETELAVATIDEPFEAEVGPPAPEEVTEPIVVSQEMPEVEGGGPTVITPPPTIEVTVPPQAGIGALRQEIATRLQQHPDARIKKVRFTVYLESSVGDLSTLPSALRGSLSGPGSLSAEVTVTKEGDFNKGQVEQFAESLPNMPGAEYGADLYLVVPAPTDVTGDGESN